MTTVQRGPAAACGRSRGAWMRIVTGAVAALAAGLLLPAAGSAATPADLELLSQSPRIGPLVIQTPTGPVDFSAGRFRLRVTPAGGTPSVITGFCVDLQHPIATGTVYPVTLQTDADDPALDNAANNSVAWLIANADAFIAAAGDPSLEAGAIQLAIWELLGETVGANPSDNQALNVRADFYKTQAAGKSVAGPLTASASPATGLVGGATTVNLTGSPGTDATLAASGPGTLGRTQVTFDALGRAQVALTSTGAAGTVSITVSTNGARLTRAARAGGNVPQTTEFLIPQTFTAQTSVTFNAPITPLVTPTAAVVVTKAGPARVAAGKYATYQIRVFNGGRGTARNVVVTDRLPEVMSLNGRRGSFQLRDGNPTWTLNSLRPGARRFFSLRLRIDADAAGVHCNRASVRVSNRTRNARACTLVLRQRQTQAPRVTG